MCAEKFTLTRFKNQSGSQSWRVSRVLDGIRVRRNFKTREEAAAERTALELRALNAAAGLGYQATLLSKEQLRTAELLFQRVAGKKHGLEFYVDYALQSYKEPEERKTLSEAITAYVDSKAHEFGQNYLSRPQNRRVKSDLKRFQESFGNRHVEDFKAPEIVAYLEKSRPSMKTFNNRRGLLGTFFKFAYHHGWIAENPILRVPCYRIRQRRGMAKTLTLEQCQRLMDHFEVFEDGRWIPYFSLCLFAGIRPCVPDGEIAKLRPTDINLDTGIISISGEVSKVREPRKIAIQSNLAAWLKAYPLDRFPIVVKNFEERRVPFRAQFGLTHDVLRHTFISMFVAKFRSIGEAAIQAGNSESIIRKHYLDMKDSLEAENFFNIRPKRSHSTSFAEAPRATVDTQLSA